MLINKIFYNIKPFIPRRLQIFVRRWIIAYKREKYGHIWPIDPAAGTPPEGWQGWPNNKKIALILSHDVDTQKGHDKCYRLMEIEEILGFRSSFNFVAEKYAVSKTLIEDLKNRGFEVCIHGLNHDGKLFSSRQIFDERAKRINGYLKEWGSTGFTSPSMHRNLNWMHALNINHSTSTFDTDPFEPQPDGAGTIFPFWVQNNSEKMRPSKNDQFKHPKILRPSKNVQFSSRSKKAKLLTGDIQKVFRGLDVELDAEIDGNGTLSEGRKGYVELPYTLPQDFTLFILMKEKNNKIWKDKFDWIAEKGGMALFNSHPDYINFNKQKNGYEEYDIKLYIEFLEYIKSRYKDQYWHMLPKDIARFWKQNYSL
jgi:peptidoglycan/xylan/chitin deacetylase (PgdA/CDA1 family)